MKVEHETAAEMVLFQGPHFGDRYGIADAWVSAVAKADVRVLASACTGATVQIVLREGASAAAIDALSAAFTIPTSGGAG